MTYSLFIRIGALLALAVLFFGNSSLRVTAQSSPIPLRAVVAAGQVSTTIHSQGYYQPVALLQVQNVSNAPLLLNIEQGTMLNSAKPDYNSLVLLSTFITLTPQDPPNTCPTEDAKHRAVQQVSLDAGAALQICSFGYTLTGPNAQGRLPANDDQAPYQVAADLAAAPIRAALDRLVAHGGDHDPTRFWLGQFAVWLTNPTNALTTDELFRRLHIDVDRNELSALVSPPPPPTLPPTTTPTVAPGMALVTAAPAVVTPVDGATTVTAVPVSTASVESGSGIPMWMWLVGGAAVLAIGIGVGGLMNRPRPPVASPAVPPAKPDGGDTPRPPKREEIPVPVVDIREQLESYKPVTTADPDAENTEPVKPGEDPGIRTTAATPSARSGKISKGPAAPEAAPEATEILNDPRRKPATAAAKPLPNNEFYLQCIDGELRDSVHPIPDQRCILTRQKPEEIEIKSVNVSAPHALLQINKDTGAATISDLNSSNGTTVAGQPVPPVDADGNPIEKPVASGAVIMLGDVMLRYDQSTRKLTWTNAPGGQTVAWPLTGKSRWMITRRQIPFIYLNDRAVSTPHAYIDISQGFELRPLRNTNVTLVNDNLITASLVIQPGSSITLGSSTFYLRTKINKVPERIGPYQVKDFIASGGMADVYQVQQAGHQEILALKFPQQERYLESPEFRQRWKQEIEIVRYVSQNAPAGTNIVRYHDDGQDRGLPYLVTGYIAGCSLREIRRHLRDTPLDPGNVYDIGRLLAESLIYLHDRQVAHCDIKPGNLLFDRQGRLYLADFGIATRFGQKTPSMATRDYMAPEQPRGVAAGAVLDLYAVGALLYLLLTGSKWNSAKEAGEEQTDDVAQEKEAAARRKEAANARFAALPVEIRDLINACIEVDASKRLSDAHIVLNTLNRRPEHGNLAALVNKAIA